MIIEWSLLELVPNRNDKERFNVTPITHAKSTMYHEATAGVAARSKHAADLLALLGALIRIAHAHQHIASKIQIAAIHRASK